MTEFCYNSDLLVACFCCQEMDGTSFEDFMSMLIERLDLRKRKEEMKGLFVGLFCSSSEDDCCSGDYDDYDGYCDAD